MWIDVAHPVPAFDCLHNPQNEALLLPWLLLRLRFSPLNPKEEHPVPHERSDAQFLEPHPSPSQFGWGEILLVYSEIRAFVSLVYGGLAAPDFYTWRLEGLPCQEQLNGFATTLSPFARIILLQKTEFIEACIDSFGSISTGRRVGRKVPVASYCFGCGISYRGANLKNPTSSARCRTARGSFS